MHSFKRWTVVVIAIAGMIPASSAAAQRPHDSRTCVKTYTAQMFRNAAITAYASTRTPTARDRFHLRRFERCARYPWTRAIDERIWARSIKANAARKLAALPMDQAVASFYDDSGATASGEHFTYGFASLIFPFGTRIEFCFTSCAIGIDQDHGPYIGGRTFDLNEELAQATGLINAGVGTVRYRVLK